jgi:biotin operon repressor
MQEVMAKFEQMKQEFMKKNNPFDENNNNTNYDTNPLLLALKNLKKLKDDELKSLATRWRANLFWEIRGLDTISIEPLKPLIHRLAGEIEYLSGLLVYLSEDIKLKFPETLVAIMKASAWCNYLASEVQGEVPAVNLQKSLDNLIQFVTRTARKAEQVADYIEAFEMHKLEEKGLVTPGISEKRTTTVKEVQQLLREEEPPKKELPLDKTKLSKTELQILQILEGRGKEYLHANELAKILNITREHVRNVCSGLRKFGLVESHTKKGYRISEVGRQFLRRLRISGQA